MREIAYFYSGDSAFLTLSERVDAYSWYHALYIPAGILWVITTIFFVMWMSRSYSNTIAVKQKETKYSPSRVIVSHFVPILQFFTPYIAMKEMYAILVKREPKSDHKYRAPFLIKSWWFFWWTAIFLWIVSDKFGKGLIVFTRGGYINNGWLDLMGDLCDLVMIILTYRIISKIGAEQSQDRSPAMSNVNLESQPSTPNSSPEVPYVPYQPYSPETSTPAVTKETFSQPNTSSPPPPPLNNTQPQPAKPAEKKDDLDDTSRFTW
ncbi:DUF4328 domain-containing protein [Risungbinella massiliensis]|uniref:DUF4328 domain-containing protein n=1 Tax=Risungbinella massiliensis TaxID=1329796 RepID=UPI0005CC4683|nr:DUF4328 domain-containing protein [Risungbinella massiliensis]